MENSSALRLDRLSLESSRLLSQRVKEVRKIIDLQWVRQLTEADAPWPTHRSYTAAQRKGRAYEKKAADLVEELLPGHTVLRGVWFQYVDRHGGGIAQPDYVVSSRKCVYVFEVKLTHTQQAFRQLQDLYEPLVRGYFRRPVTLIEICKTLTPDKNLRLIKDLSEASANGRVYTIHWRP